MNIIIQLLGDSPLDLLCAMSVMASIIIQVMKNVLPKKFPTKLLVLLVSIFIVFGYSFTSESITADVIFSDICAAYMVSFASMFGFDSLQGMLSKRGGDVNGE